MFEPYIEDFALMVEAGFVAVYQGDEANARKLFHAASLLKPEHPAPKLGLSHIAIHKLQLDEARTLLEEVLTRESDNQIARALLGLCLLLGKTNKGEGIALIQEAMSKTSETSVHNLGQAAMTWLENEERKARIVK
ncbi:MAG: sctG [Chlamydiales bacterium]|jgi:thioredoxin-like negative regulator of GroEL|nr:sctG [Chlamydiales bacterium]